VSLTLRHQIRRIHFCCIRQCSSPFTLLTPLQPPHGSDLRHSLRRDIAPAAASARQGETADLHRRQLPPNHPHPSSAPIPHALSPATFAVLVVALAVVASTGSAPISLQSLRHSSAPESAASVEKVRWLICFLLSINEP
jgi:hypothetical protein